MALLPPPQSTECLRLILSGALSKMQELASWSQIKGHKCWGNRYSKNTIRHRKKSQNSFLEARFIIISWFVVVSMKSMKSDKEFSFTSSQGWSGLVYPSMPEKQQATMDPSVTAHSKHHWLLGLCVNIHSAMAHFLTSKRGLKGTVYFKDTSVMWEVLPSSRSLMPM